MIVGVTGHRPVSMPGISERTNLVRLDEQLISFAEMCLCRFPLGAPDQVISGMAEGWDMACAEACVKLGLPFIAAVPFEGQERHWSGRSQERYRALLARADRVEIISRWRGKHFYLKRDEWIVDHSDAILGLCGKKTGGSAYTLHYASRWCVPSFNLWEDWVHLHQ